jgi:hypothetical protein
MSPSILARVRYRLRTSELVSHDWDEDEVRAPKPASRRRRRFEITDSVLLAEGGSPDHLRALVRRAHRDKSERDQESIFHALLRRRVRLVAQVDRAARSARAALTPEVHAVKTNAAVGHKEEA